MKLFTLPNLMTLGNLLCGCLGIFAVFEGNYLWASVLIFIAAVLDFGDGFVARLLNQTSPIGKELDSLADVVTFGILPAFMLFFLTESAMLKQIMNESYRSEFYYTTMKYLPMSIALFSALRLAKFNVDTRQSDSFIGVPTPANALVVASFPFIIAYQPLYASLLNNYYVFVAYSCLMSYLLIAELPLMAFKFKTFGWQENKVKYSFLIFSGVVLAFLKFMALPVIVLAYVVVSLITLRRKKG